MSKLTNPDAEKETSQRENSSMNNAANQNAMLRTMRIEGGGPEDYGENGGQV